MRGYLPAAPSCPGGAEKGRGSLRKIRENHDKKRDFRKVAGRYAGGRFTLNGREYRLARNDGANHLHGGEKGFDKYVWDCVELPQGLRFTRLSPHGEEDCVKLSGGYDCNFILSGVPAAWACAPDTGITMTVETDQPGVQFYSGNFLTERTGKNGAVYDRRYGFCLETQHYPDCVNQPQWPTPILRTGETFRSRTRYVFGIE